ncbi:hypothetical protein CDCA_CDCA15G4072 [Cyanidium caldarium]|uniref:FCP1 homology domain-containing protein n=1 Tax=Cyanidium caldarium TaxID=2771 RepID=A0AAV9J0E4_CYACA|nr:hypothetical protein CDCA_CDCA15G4072 [Cyanidium caldarium]
MENADSGAGDTALSQRRERPARRRVRSRDLRATAVDGAPALRPARWSFAGRLAAAEWSDWPSVNRADDDDDEATVPEAPLPNRVRSVSSGSADGGSRLDWRDGSWAPREPRRSKARAADVEAGSGAAAAPAAVMARTLRASWWSLAATAGRFWQDGRRWTQRYVRWAGRSLAAPAAERRYRRTVSLRSAKSNSVPLAQRGTEQARRLARVLWARLAQALRDTAGLTLRAAATGQRWLYAVAQALRAVPTWMQAHRKEWTTYGCKPLWLAIALAHNAITIALHASEWLTRLALERLLHCVHSARADVATLIESIPCGGIVPRFSVLSCGPCRPLTCSPQERKLLVLDLDETLVHSSFKESRGCDLTLQVVVDDVPTMFFVRKRPHLELFMHIVQQWYDLVIFTASLRRYADPLVDALDPRGTLVKARYFRDDCIRRPPNQFVKDLTVVSADLGKVIIVDNSPASYALHAANALPIEAWYDDPFDEELLHLLPLLRSLSVLEDVRSVLSLRLTGGSLATRYQPLFST